MSNVTKRELVEENEELVGALEAIMDACASGADHDTISEIAESALGPEDEEDSDSDEEGDDE